MMLQKTSEHLLSQRYPQLAFLLHLLSEEPWTFCEEEKNGWRNGQTLYQNEDVDALFQKVDLRALEVLYIFGLGLGYYAQKALEWLEEDPKRDLVFIEEDIEVVRLFLESENAAQILNHPQIHLRFLMEPKQWKPFLDACASEFCYEHVDLIVLESLRKAKPHRFSKMRLHLLRRTTVHHAIFLDDAYYHVLSKNVLRNFSQINTAFYANRFKGAFKNVPALICGAGPSLQEDFASLRGLEEQALIFAGGSAITALSKRGILPHFGVAIDPNEEEVHRFKESVAFETPLLYTNRLHPDVFHTCNGPKGYIHAKTGGPLEAWWEKKLGIEPIPLQEGFDIEALSVTTTALELAALMGCNPIILIGVDLAFTNEALYVSGIVEKTGVSLDERKKETRASEKLLRRKDRLGNPVYTLVKWVMESEAIARFAKINSDREFINCTSGGIGFPGLPYQPLQSVKLPHSFDVKGRVHQLIEENRFSFSAAACLKTLKDSLQKAKRLTQEALAELERIKDHKGDPERGRMVFYQMELESLEIYSCLLHQSAMTFEKTFNRLSRFPFFDVETHEKEKRCWQFLHSKWKSLNDLIMYYLDSSFTK